MAGVKIRPVMLNTIKTIKIKNPLLEAVKELAFP
jgi:hypothetical protein